MIGHGFQVHCAMLWLGYVTADSTSLSVFYLTAAEEACTGVYKYYKMEAISCRNFFTSDKIFDFTAQKQTRA